LGSRYFATVACTFTPGYVQRDLDRYRRATGVNVQATVAKYLDPNARVILRIVPRTSKEKGK